MMDESEFHRLADRLLSTLADRLEAEDEDAILSVDFEGGHLTIETADKRQIMVTKHTPTRQVWIASPISGGLHLMYSESQNTWALGDGSTLEAILTRELKALTSQEFLK